MKQLCDYHMSEADWVAKRYLAYKDAQDRRNPLTANHYRALYTQANDKHIEGIAKCTKCKEVACVALTS